MKNSINFLVTKVCVCVYIYRLAIYCDNKIWGKNDFICNPIHLVKKSLLDKNIFIKDQQLIIPCIEAL